MPTIWNLVPMYPNPSHTTEKKKNGKNTAEVSSGILTFKTGVL